MENKKKCKIVYNLSNRTYTVWATDNQGEWDFQNSYPVNGYDGLGWINLRILWDIDLLVFLGYRFIGVKVDDI